MGYRYTWMVKMRGPEEELRKLDEFIAGRWRTLYDAEKLLRNMEGLAGKEIATSFTSRETVAEWDFCFDRLCRNADGGPREAGVRKYRGYSKLADPWDNMIDTLQLLAHEHGCALASINYGEDMTDVNTEFAHDEAGEYRVSLGIQREIREDD